MIRHLLFAALLAPSAAFAQAPAAQPAASPTSAPASAPTDTVSRARALFADGQQNYQRGDYPAALKSFSGALDLVRRPSILFNIAQCHRQLNNRERALIFFEAHLQAWEKQNPGKVSPHHDEIQGHIQRLRAELARQKEQRRREALQRELRAKEARRKVTEARRREELNRKLRRQRRTKTILGYSAVGAGAAFAVTAAVMYGVGFSSGDEAHAAYLAADEEDEIRDSRADVEAAKDKLIVGHVFVGLTAAAAAYGLYELLTRPSVESSGQERAGRISLRISPAAGGAGVLLGGRF